MKEKNKQDAWLYSPISEQQQNIPLVISVEELESSSNELEKKKENNKENYQKKMIRILSN